MQTHNRTGLRILGGVLLATSAWIALAASTQAQGIDPADAAINTVNYTAQLENINGSVTDVGGAVGGVKEELVDIKNSYLFGMKIDGKSTADNTGDLVGLTTVIRDNIGSPGDVQTVTVGNSGDPCIPGDVVYSPPTNSVINLLSQIVNILKGPTATGACTATSASLNDAMGMADMARRDALARSVLASGNGAPVLGQWLTSCANGFNPTVVGSTSSLVGAAISGALSGIDQEASNIVKEKAKNRLTGCDQIDKFVRYDRSLESLIGPLEYQAPGVGMMVEPTTDNSVYARFPKTLKETGEAYADIFGAYSFCTAVTAYSRPSLASGDDGGAAAIARVDEALESKTVSNCWRFFEERVAYPQGFPESSLFGKRHAQQAARCQADYKQNIISKEAADKCMINGRSTLKARADAAYRSDSPTFTAFLNKGLKYETQVQVLGAAAGDMERFEQSLALERQTMTDSLSFARKR